MNDKIKWMLWLAAASIFIVWLRSMQDGAFILILTFIIFVLIVFIGKYKKFKGNYTDAEMKKVGQYLAIGMCVAISFLVFIKKQTVFLNINPNLKDALFFLAWLPCAGIAVIKIIQNKPFVFPQKLKSLSSSSQEKNYHEANSISPSARMRSINRNPIATVSLSLFVIGIIGLLYSKVYGNFWIHGVHIVWIASFFLFVSFFMRGFIHLHAFRNRVRPGHNFMWMLMSFIMGSMLILVLAWRIYFDFTNNKPY